MEHRVDLPDFSPQGYQVEGVLGQNSGGGRVTYLATQITSGQQVVLKQFQFATMGANWTGYKAIQREIDILRSLEHPGIPAYLADIEMSNGFCLVQEYVLAEPLSQVGLLTIPQVYQIAVSVLDILIYLQEGTAEQQRVEPILHRDIKPENILLAQEYLDPQATLLRDQGLQPIYLVDFGLARIGGRYLSESTEMGGTFGFMPPEQLLKRELTKAADLYGLGMTLVSLLTGTPAAQITDLIDISTFKVDFKSRLPQTLDPHWRDWLETLVEPNPADRFSDAREALQQLQQITQETGDHRSRPINRLTAPVMEGKETALFSPAQVSRVLSPSAPDLYQFQFEFAQISIRPRAGFSLRGEREIKTSFYDWEAMGYRVALGEGVDLEMIWIPGGEFCMGSPDHELGHTIHEGPRHQISVPAFFLGRYPITQAQWQQVARWDKVERDLPQDPSRFKQGNRPVETVSWQEAVEFCARLSRWTGQHYRLPSEAEWEYACRAGTVSPFHVGNTLTPMLANYDGRHRYGSGPRGRFRGQTTAVGALGIANGFGVSEMHGNVWEWCSVRWHRTYDCDPVDDLRVIRGGSWHCGPRLCRSASRQAVVNFWRSDQIGLRVCCDPSLP